jgi:hypothetical protein
MHFGLVWFKRQWWNLNTPAAREVVKICCVTYGRQMTGIVSRYGDTNKTGIKWFVCCAPFENYCSNQCH